MLVTHLSVSFLTTEIAKPTGVDFIDKYSSRTTSTTSLPHKLQLTTSRWRTPLSLSQGSEKLDGDDGMFGNSWVWRTWRNHWYMAAMLGVAIGGSTGAWTLVPFSLQPGKVSIWVIDQLYVTVAYCILATVRLHTFTDFCSFFCFSVNKK